MVHMDDFIDGLLTEERVCDVILPRLQKRSVLEEAGTLEPRQSLLDEDLEDLRVNEDLDGVEQEKEEKSKERSKRRERERSKERERHHRRNRDDSPYERRERRDRDHDRSRDHDRERRKNREDRDRRDRERERERPKRWVGFILLCSPGMSLSVSFLI